MSGSIVLLLFLIFQFLSVCVQPQTTTSTSTTTEEFILRGFRENKSEILLEGAATIEPDGLLRLTDRKSNVTGTAFYRKPVRLLDHGTQAKVCSFSTSFVFLIAPSSSSNGGFGFTFTLSPTPNRPGAQPGHYFGLVNQSNDGNQTNHVFAVKFDTVIDGTDAKSNHVGLNFNSVTSDIEEPFAYYDDNERKEDFPLDSVPIRVRLDFDGPTETLNLIVSPARIAIAPSTPLISRRVPKMSEIVQKEMYIGFTASTGKDKLSAHCVLGWSFRSSRDGLTADRLVLQDLPLWHLNTVKKKGFQAMVTKILIATSLIVSILVVGVLAFLIRKKSLSNVQRRKNLKALILLKHYRYNEVKRFTNSFACVLGEGGFGTVYKGNLLDGRPVAVKVLKDSKGNGADFINEVTSMSQTSHVNIVSLVGFCYEGSKRVIVYEFLENGSLDQFISSKDSLSVEKLYEIALGVARGLEYLHYGCKTRIVHFDIKPQNVLLDCNLCPKVSDFGLAKLCEKKESIMSLMETRGTIGYIAPEMISRVYGSVSHKSDVYSYGMLVLEMIGATRKDRDENAASNSSSIYFPDWIYKDLENGQYSRIFGEELTRGEEEITKKMILVSLWCIQSCPSNRPSMNRVVEMMEGSLDALEVPPRPVFQITISPLQDSSTLSGDISIHTEE